MTLADCLIAGDDSSDRYWQLLEETAPAHWPQLLELASHPDPDVRRGLVSTLPLLDERASAGLCRCDHVDGWDDADARTADAVLRLTNPAGPGAELFSGVACLYADRAHGRPEQAVDLLAWQIMNEMLDIAPDRAPAMFTATAACLRDDPLALRQLTRESALATWLGLTEDEESS